MKKVKLKCSFFNNLYLYKDCNEKEFIDEINKISGSERFETNNSEGKTFTYYDTNSTYGVLIWVKKQSKNKTLEMIYHELGHALIFIFAEMQTEINDNTSELFLYTQENLVKQIEKEL